MSIDNAKYRGYSNANDLISYLMKHNIGDLNYIKIVKTQNEYYAVGIEAPIKQIIIGLDIVWYKDISGYFVSSKANNFKSPYKIEKNDYRNYTSKIYEEYLKRENKIELYNIVKNNIELVNNSFNCYFVTLINSFTDKYYLKEEFDNYKYSSNRNWRLMKEGLLDINDIEVIAINPFKSLIKINYDGNELETSYRTINNIDKNGAIVGFQIKPIIQVDSNYINGDNIINGKSISDKVIIKIFNGSDEDIEKLAKNDSIELNNNIINSIINNNYNIKLYIEKLSERRKVELLIKNGHLIKYISNPSDILIRVAIINDFSCISKVSNMTIEKYEELLVEYSECINYLHDMSEEIQRHLLKKDINNIKFFKFLNSKVIKEFIIKINFELLQNNNVKKEFLNLLINEELNKYKNSLGNEPFNYSNEINKQKIKNNYIKILESLNEINDKEILVFNNDEPISLYLETIFEIINCNKLEMASELITDTGLYLLSPIIYKLLTNSKEVKLIVGNLREYIYGQAIQINKRTAQYINLFIDDGMKLGTVIYKFYHGNIIILYGEKYSAVMLGSSNISLEGFYKNNETNIIMIFNNTSKKIEEFKKYYNSLWIESKEFNNLDINKFLNKDLFTENNEDVNKESIKRRNDIERTFYYLFKEKPNRVIDNINIFKESIDGDEYCGFYFESYNKLLILESLKYQNAIYIYKDVENVDKFISVLKTKEASTKTKEYVDKINHTNDYSYIKRVKDIIEDNKLK